MAGEVEISFGSCHKLLTEDFGMHRVSAKFVPRHLTDDLLRANDENIMKNVITSDVIWVYGDDVETKPVFTLEEFCFVLSQESMTGAPANESSVFFGPRGLCFMN